MKKVLVANRGEIALRVKRACAARGIATVFVCSTADQDALFTREAEELVILGEADPRDSYLNVEKIIAAARKTNADAIHPGYGFLSENAPFARAVEQAGLIFIGPSPENIEALGSKSAARKIATQCRVPITLGAPAGLTDDQLVSRAQKIGFPVLIKAVAGGGGRGMRLAHDVAELRSFLPRARAEAQKFFSSDDVYLERYIEQPRHVEVQLMGDGLGAVVHFGTRDCSTQRRHQKLIEEATAPNLSPRLRAAIETAAVKIAKKVQYRSAGTAEFLVKGNTFYFLEMNTRIQVEHPVTEMVTGVDLVDLQLSLALSQAARSKKTKNKKASAGAPPRPQPFLKQKEVRSCGHAIEFRIYAEDPEQNFMPQSGLIRELSRGDFPFVREDSGFAAGDTVHTHYDAMLSKLIVWGATREEAVARSHQVLQGYKLVGLKSTLPFHRWILRTKAFRAGPVDIHFLSREYSAANLSELYAAEARDSAHRGAQSSANNGDTVGIPVEMRVLRTARSEHGAATKEIHVMISHEAEGLFLVRPLLASGKLSRRSEWVCSNSLETAIKSLRNNHEKDV